MYSNENKKGFSVLDLVVRILFAALFIFILVWLFNNKMPNLSTFYSNVFRENISYMQEAGESYFTDDKMPANIGDTTKITLGEMLDKNLLLEFVDKDGNKCNNDESYVSITKEEDETYTLKTNLVCNKESDYTVKVLGCHTYCKDKSCTKTCTKEKIITYQYKKQVKGTKTTYSCSKGYTLKGKYCYKTSIVDTISAKNTQTEYKNIEIPANINKVYTDYVKNEINPTTYTIEVDKYYDKIEKVETKVVSKTCYKEVTTKSCTTTYNSYSYQCNCTGGWYKGRYVAKCSTCTGSTPVETCSNKVNKVAYDCSYNTTNVSYICPDNTTETSDGKCLGKTTRSIKECPSGYNNVNSGTDNMTCAKYSCPDGYYSVGKKDNLKCYKYNNTCDEGYTLKGNKCTKTETTTKEVMSCPSEYKLENTVCNKYSTDKVEATAKKTTYKYYTYKWSEKTSLSGWTKTGKTKTKEGKEVCK